MHRWRCVHNNTVKNSIINQFNYFPTAYHDYYTNFQTKCAIKTLNPIRPSCKISSLSLSSHRTILYECTGVGFMCPIFEQRAVLIWFSWNKRQVKCVEPISRFININLKIINIFFFKYPFDTGVIDYCYFIYSMNIQTDETVKQLTHYLPIVCSMKTESKRRAVQKQGSCNQPLCIHINSSVTWKTQA